MKNLEGQIITLTENKEDGGKHILKIYHIVPVARLDAFMALKLSRLESFRALKSIGDIGGV